MVFNLRTLSGSGGVDSRQFGLCLTGQEVLRLILEKAGLPPFKYFVETLDLS